MRQEEMNALISVIMPAYNAEKFIADAIDSVLKQTYTDLELIIIDDGSTDKTSQIAKQYITWDNRIIYIYQDRGGRGKARNKGLGHAKGRYIAFLDADDIWLPEKLAVQTEAMSTGNIDLVFSDAYIFKERPVTEKRIGVSAGTYKGEEAIQKFLRCNYIPMLTAIARKLSIENVSGFSEQDDIHEDYHLWIRMLINGCIFRGIETPLAYYRVHRASSSSGEGKMLIRTINTLQDIKHTWPGYATTADESVYSLIDSHLGKINISRWDLAGRLLQLRNGLSKENVSVAFWKHIYYFFGKNVFRILFNLKVNKKHTEADSKMKLSLV